MNNNREIDQKVRDWIHSMPGGLDGVDPNECLRKAWAAPGSPGSVDEFQTVMARYGFIPKEVRPGLYRLFTPAPPIQSFPARRT